MYINMEEQAANIMKQRSGYIMNKTKQIIQRR